METVVRRVVDQLTKRRPPEALYHYTSGEGLLGILRTATIHATRIAYLNDTQELFRALSIARELLQQRRGKVSNRFDLGLYEVFSEVLKGFRGSDIHVVSFSELGDQLGQWRGYCPPANGYSIGFNADSLRSAAGRPWERFLAPCVYDEGDQQRVIDGLFDLVVSAAKKMYDPDADNLDRVYREGFKVFEKIVAMVAPMIKHHSFTEEAEWRIVAAAAAFEDVGGPRFRAGRSMLVPYNELAVPRRGEALAVERIVVGPTPHSELAREAVKDLLASLRNEATAVDCSEIPFRSW